MQTDWLLLIIPVSSYLVAQIVKLAFDGIRGNLDIKHMWSKYGGMPSAHSAFVVSLTVYIGLREGFASIPFAIAFVFGILAVRDAIGFRKMIGDQAKVLNALVASQPVEVRNKQPQLIEEVGHTPLEAFVGSCFGAIIALLAWYFI